MTRIVLRWKGAGTLSRGVVLRTPRYRPGMRVKANGEPVDLPGDATVSDLLAALGLGSKWVLVERNGSPVRRADLDTTRLEDGDRLELVRAVAGG